MGTVATLKTAKPTNASAPRGASRTMRRKLRRQGLSAAAIGAVACTLTGLSLDHLAHGVSLITGATGWEPWAMAIGIDLAYVGLEVAGLCCATDRCWQKIAKLTGRALVATMGGSAVLNALAFATLAEGYAFKAAAAALGLAIPALVYILTRIAATLYLDCTK